MSEQLNVRELLRVRIGLVPRDVEYSIAHPHIDYPYPHKVGLLYLNDCDGETYIYKNRYDWKFTQQNPNAAKEAGPNNSVNLYRQYMNWSLDKNSDGTYKHFEILEKVMPKRNRIVLFDGSHFHSSSTPTTQQLRWAINYNFK